MENFILWIFIILISIANISFQIYLKKSIESKIDKKMEDYKNYIFIKYKSYSDLISLFKPFLSDPWITYNEALERSNKLIDRFNNEILPFASKELVHAIESALYLSSTKIADENELTKKMEEVIWVMRKEMNLEELDKINFHAVNLEFLEKTYKKNEIIEISIK